MVLCGFEISCGNLACPRSNVDLVCDVVQEARSVSARGFLSLLPLIREVRSEPFLSRVPCFLDEFASGAADRGSERNQRQRISHSIVQYSPVRLTFFR